MSGLFRAAFPEEFTVPQSDSKEAFIVAFNVRGEKLSSYFDGQQFDVIIINAPRGQPPPTSNISKTKFNKKLLMDILIEAKNYLRNEN